MKPLGPRIEQLTQTIGHGPRLVPGLVVRKWTFCIHSGGAEPSEKDGPRAMPLFSRLFGGLSQVGTP